MGPSHAPGWTQLSAAPSHLHILTPRPLRWRPNIRLSFMTWVWVLSSRLRFLIFFIRLSRFYFRQYLVSSIVLALSSLLRFIIFFIRLSCFHSDSAVSAWSLLLCYDLYSWLGSYMQFPSSCKRSKIHVFALIFTPHIFFIQTDSPRNKMHICIFISQCVIYTYEYYICKIVDSYTRALNTKKGIYSILIYIFE